MLTVKSLMSRIPETIRPTDTLRDALATMNNSACRELPVLDNGRIVGIVTDRDLRLAVNSPLLAEEEAVARADLLSETSVAACMTTGLITTTSETPAVEAAEMLKLNRISAMPVLHEGALVGMISTTDFVDYFIENTQI
ncbi:MAG: CBS domain-containing protein [Gammaproteobacteria bacterium]